MCRVLFSSCYRKSNSDWFEHKWSLWTHATKKFTRRASLTGTSIQVLSGLQLQVLAVLLALPHVSVYNGHTAGAVQASHLPPLQTFWSPTLRKS